MPESVETNGEPLARFIASQLNEEAEECAKIAVEIAYSYGNDRDDRLRALAAQDVASAIKRRIAARTKT